MRTESEKAWPNGQIGHGMGQGLGTYRDLHRIPLLPLVVLATMIGAAAGWADDSQTPRDLQIPSGMRRCQAYAYLVDQDINGVAIRKGPNATSSLIAMLPALRMKPAGGGLELYGAEVNIVGTDSRGWFLIEGAEYEPDDDAAGPPRKVQNFGDTGQVYQGRGWVHGSRLGTTIVATRGLRDGPGRSAKILHPMAQKDSDPEINATFLDCEGGAVRLRTAEKGKALEGWITPDPTREKLCSNQRTTCS